MSAVQLCLDRIAEKCVETQTNVDTSSKEPYPMTNRLKVILVFDVQ